MKFRNSSLFVLICSLLLVSCGSSKKEEKVKDLKVGDKMALLEGVNLDYNNTFFDDFSTGITVQPQYAHGTGSLIFTALSGAAQFGQDNTSNSTSAIFILPK